MVFGLKLRKVFETDVFVCLHLYSTKLGDHISLVHGSATFRNAHWSIGRLLSKVKIIHTLKITINMNHVRTKCFNQLFQETLGSHKNEKKNFENVFKRYHLLDFRSTLCSSLPHTAGQLEKPDNTTHTHTHTHTHTS